MSKALQEFMAAVAGTLDHAFGYEVYQDEIEQGFQEPCFFIEIIQAGHERISNARYKFNVTMHICFFPGKEPDRADAMVAAAEKLYDLFEILQGATRKYRCHSQSHHSGGDILNFTFSTAIHIVKLDDTALMKRLWHKATVS